MGSPGELGRGNGRLKLLSAAVLGTKMADLNFIFKGALQNSVKKSLSLTNINLQVISLLIVN